MRKLALFPALSLLAVASADAASITVITGTLDSGRDQGGTFFPFGQDLAGLPYRLEFIVGSDELLAPLPEGDASGVGTPFQDLSARLIINNASYELVAHGFSSFEHVNGSAIDTLSYYIEGPGCEAFCSRTVDLQLSGANLFDENGLLSASLGSPDGAISVLGNFEILSTIFPPDGESDFIVTQHSFGSFGTASVPVVAPVEPGGGTPGGAPGSTPDNPILPGEDDPATPGFDIPVRIIDPFSRAFIDPVYAIGYDYAVDSGGPLFTSVLVPGALPGGDTAFELLLGGASYALTAGVAFDFTPYFAGGVSAFGIRGLDVSEMIDPTDPNGFVTGLTFSQAGSVTVVMTPVTIDTGPVPEPATWAMMIGGFGLVGGALRRRPIVRRAIV